MLDTITRPQTEFTEAQAAARLTEIDAAGEKRPPIRRLAEEWGWSKSTVDRFLARLSQPSEQQTRDMPISEHPPAAKDDGEEFKWTPENTVVRNQPAIAVYGNPHGELVLRMEALEYSDEDPFIFINPDRVDAVIAAMQAVKRQILEERAAS